MSSENSCACVSDSALKLACDFVTSNMLCVLDGFYPLHSMLHIFFLVCDGEPGSFLLLYCIQPELSP